MNYGFIKTLSIQNIYSESVNALASLIGESPINLKGGGLVMSVTLYEKAKTPRTLPGSCLIEDKRVIILERLKNAIQKLKEGRKEIREVVKLVLEMKNAGDDFADMIIVAVVETFVSKDDPQIFRDYITETN